MKKFLTFIIICVSLISCVTAFSACTDGEEDETHNIIIGDDNEDDTPIATTDGGTIDDSWELGGVPIG